MDVLNILQDSLFVVIISTSLYHIAYEMDFIRERKKANETSAYLCLCYPIRQLHLWLCHLQDYSRYPGGIACAMSLRHIVDTITEILKGIYKGGQSQLIGNLLKESRRRCQPREVIHKYFPNLNKSYRVVLLTYSAYTFSFYHLLQYPKLGIPPLQH